jgi:transposase
MLDKYTIKQLHADFPDDQACLDWLVEYLYPGGIFCPSCGPSTHYKVSGRRAYACGKCGHHTYPLADTIFHKSSTALTDWFYAIYLMSSHKSGISASQLQRDIGVTYKCAWRMLHQIRTMMEAPDEVFDEEVEIDESFVHANVFKRSSARNTYGPTGNRKGEVLFGVVQRNGKARIWHVHSAGARVLHPIIKQHIAKGSIIHSDGYKGYVKLRSYGYEHRTTNHSIGEFYTPDSYTQNVENLWSHLKRGIKGIYRHVSADYLQLYANEYAYRYTHRRKRVIFWTLLKEVKRLSLQPSSTS